MDLNVYLTAAISMIMENFTSYMYRQVNFETSTPNDPKIIMNTTRSNVPHICVTVIRDPQISVHRSISPTVLKL